MDRYDTYLEQHTLATLDYKYQSNPQYKEKKKVKQAKNYVEKSIENEMGVILE